MKLIRRISVKCLSHRQAAGKQNLGWSGAGIFGSLWRNNAVISDWSYTSTFWWKKKKAPGGGKNPPPQKGEKKSNFWGEKIQENFFPGPFFFFLFQSVQIPIQKEYASKLADSSLPCNEYQLFLVIPGAEQMRMHWKMASFATNKSGFISYSWCISMGEHPAAVGNLQIIQSHSNQCNSREDFHILPWVDLKHWSSSQIGYHLNYHWGHSKVWVEIQVPSAEFLKGIAALSQKV